MSLRGWRIVRLTWSRSNHPFPHQSISSHLQKSQNLSATRTNNSVLVRLRCISSALINRSSDGIGDGPGNGGPKEPPEESLGQDKAVSESVEDKRMWRKWIEERLAHSGSTVEESDASLSRSSKVGEAMKSSVGSASNATKEYDTSFSGSSPNKETVKRPFAPEKRTSSLFSRSTFLEEDGKAPSVPEEVSTGKSSSSLDSIFRSALKPSTNAAGNAENPRTSNLRNPFRRENVKSSFFPDRESNKNTSIGSKPGLFSQESAKRPSFFPVRQVPGKASQAPLENLPVDVLDEFEYRVLGSANDEDDPIDDDFLRDLDEIGRSARGIRGKADDDLEADEDEDWGDEKAQVLSDLALSNLEEFDLEDEEHPYRMRSDRLFFPGQTYDPEDLDLSKEADLEKPTARTRKRYPSKEVFQIADFRNPRYLSNFIRESSRILPKRHFQISGKAQRKIAREIKTARILGLMPFTSMGDPPFRFLRSRSEEDSSARFDGY